MSDMVSALEKNGHTYRSEGSVYFRIATFPGTASSRASITPASSPAHASTPTSTTRKTRDFVLWKASSARRAVVGLRCGPGRPGWHIECSAMALRVLGEPPIDIHCGGIDLIFPHHENEIAQAEGATGAAVRALLVPRRASPHGRWREDVEVAGQRLHREVTSWPQGYRASALRYQLLSVHYRKQLRFSWTSLGQCEEALKRLMDFLSRLDRVTARGRTGHRRAGGAGPPRVRRDDGGRRQRAGRPRRAVRSRANAERRHRCQRGRPGDGAVIREAFDQFDACWGSSRSGVPRKRRRRCRSRRSNT